MTQTRRHRPAKIADVSAWSRFVKEVPWFVEPGQEVVVGEGRPWSGRSADNLPVLSSLLERAKVTPVVIGGLDYELLTWGESGERGGWLCLPPHQDPHAPVHPIHQVFWSLCGGIVERFREPESWWNNQNSVLTAEAAETDLSACLEDYSWLWTDDGLDIPIRAADYYVVAVEANGNLTLSHRVSGQILLFAPDHAYDGVTELPGCPPYSLMTIDEVPDLASWIDVSAAAWTRSLDV